MPLSLSVLRAFRSQVTPPWARRRATFWAVCFVLGSGFGWVGGWIDSWMGSGVVGGWVGGERGGKQGTYLLVLIELCQVARADAVGLHVGRVRCCCVVLNGEDGWVGGLMMERRMLRAGVGGLGGGSATGRARRGQMKEPVHQERGHPRWWPWLLGWVGGWGGEGTLQRESFLASSNP